MLIFGLPEAQSFGPAVEEAQKAISLDPDLPEGYKALASLYKLKGWYKKAQEIGHKAVEAGPNNALANNALGEYYYYVGEYDKGFPFIKKAHDLSPAWAFPCSDLGDIYLSLNDPELAEQWLKRALELQPDLWVAHLALINLFINNGEYDKAIAQSQVYQSIHSGDRSSISAAAAELFSGHYEKAQEYYQKIGSQGINLAYIYWKTGKKDEAKTLFQKNSDRLQKQIEEGNELPGIRESMAAIHAVLGDKEAAFSWLDKALAAGWSDYYYALRYPLFENIRDDERFKRIMDNAKARVAEMRRRVEQMERDSSK